MEPRNLILTGPIGEGKTTRVAGALPAIRRSGRSVGGILQYGFEEEGRRVGYEVVDLATGERTELCRRPVAKSGRLERPVFLDSGVAAGSAAIRSGAREDLLVVDEVGPVELAGGGYDPVLRELLPRRRGRTLLVIRSVMLAKAVRRYGLEPVRVFDLRRDGADDLAGWLLEGWSEPGGVAGASS